MKGDVPFALGLILAPSGDRASHLTLPSPNRSPRKWAPLPTRGPATTATGSAREEGKSSLPPSKPLAPRERARPPPTTAGGTQGPQTQPPREELTTRSASLRKLTRVRPWTPQDVGGGTPPDGDLPRDVAVNGRCPVSPPVHHPRDRAQGLGYYRENRRPLTAAHPPPPKKTRTRNTPPSSRGRREGTLSPFAALYRYHRRQPPAPPRREKECLHPHPHEEERGAATPAMSVTLPPNTRSSWLGRPPRVLLRALRQGSTSVAHIGHS